MGGSGIGQYPRLITGYGAAAVSAFFLIRYRAELPIVATSLYFILVCITDTRKSKIPNLLNFSLAVFGITYGFIISSWSGISYSVLGMLLGIMLLMIPYMLGGFGAGDVKALGAVGAVSGPEAILYIFIYMAFWGGGMAILHYACNRDLVGKVRNLLTTLKTATITLDAAEFAPVKNETLRFPYAAAIALGYYTYIYHGAFF